MKKQFFFLAFLCSLGIVGCAGSHKPMYDYKNYSTTLYELKKNPSEETIKQHISELDSILEASEKQNINPPPGICIEYALLCIEQGNTDLAMELLDKEAEIYPESTVFVSKIKEEYQL